MSLIPLGFWAASAGGGAGAGSFDLLASEILTGSQASVTFSSLDTYATDYDHLQIRLSARGIWGGGNTGGNIKVTLNGQSTTYKNHFLRGNGTDVSSGNSTNVLLNRLALSSNSTDHSPMVIDILDAFNGSKNTTMRSIGGMAFSFGNWIELASGAWFDTTPVSSITLANPDGSFAGLSRFSLYGTRKAA